MCNLRRLKQPFIWLSRIRCRCGYGVHSPFAFDFITNVIYEKTFYYAYNEIEYKRLEHIIKSKSGFRRKKNNRLLLRLVNRMQPEMIIDAGAYSDAALYLQAGNKKATFVSWTHAADLDPESDIIPDFLYIHRNDDLSFITKVWERCINEARPQSMFVIEGIYDSKAMKSFWKQCVCHEKVGVTFDLYDLGILFFDKSKIKQHYIVNF